MLELQYADDNAVPRCDQRIYRSLSDTFVDAYETFGVNLNVAKTKILAQPPPRKVLEPNNIKIHQQSVEQVATFDYLGSVLNTHANLSVLLRAHMENCQRGFSSTWTVSRNENRGLSGSCCQHTALWLRNMDSVSSKHQDP